MNRKTELKLITGDGIFVPVKKINVGFPFKKTIQKWYWFGLKKEIINDGWEDLGQRDPAPTMFTIHTLCKTTVRVGKENNRLFLYCPRCLIEL